MLLSIAAFVSSMALLIISHELGHALCARAMGIEVQEFSIGYPPRLCVLAKCGRTLLSLGALPLGGFVKLAGEDDPDVPDGLRAAPLRAQLAVMAAGPMMNLVLAIAISFLCYWGGWPEAQSYALLVTGVLPHSPAQAAGLRAGDLLLEAAGTGLEEPHDLTEAIEDAQSVALLIERDGKRRYIQVRPQAGRLGVIVRSEPTSVAIQRSPPGLAFLQSVRDAFLIVLLVLAAPLLLLRSHIPLDLMRPVSPVGMARLFDQATQASLSTRWAFPLLRLTAVFSASVAAINMFPIPALDGGRMAIIVLEKLAGRKFSRTTLERISRLSMAIVLALVAIAVFYDVIYPLPHIFGWVKLLKNP